MSVHQRALKRNNPFYPALAWVLSLGLGMVFSCNTLQIPPQEEKNLDPWVILEKEACLMKCPKYKLTIYKNGFARYDGGEYAPREGVFFRYFTEDEIETLQDAFLEIPFKAFQDNYFSQIPDRQTVRITHFYDDGTIKTVVGKENRPEDILDLEKAITQLAAGGEWNVYENQGVFGEKPPEELPPPPAEIIVQLRENIIADVWVKKYFDVEMEVKKEIAPRTGYFLVTYDPAKIDPYELLKDIRTDGEVIGAQFNTKAVEARN